MSPLFWTSYALLAVAVLFGGVLLYLLLNEIGKIYLGQSTSFIRDGIQAGKQLPDVAVTASHGKERLSDLLGAARYTFVLIAQPDCSHCREAASALLRWTTRSPALQLVILVDGDDVGPYAVGAAGAVARVTSDDVRRRLRVRATPFVFLVDVSGTVHTKDVVNDDEDVRHLLERSPAPVFAELATQLEEEHAGANGPPLSSHLHHVPARAGEERS